MCYIFISLAEMNFEWSVCLFMILVSLGVNGKQDERVDGKFSKEMPKLKVKCMAEVHE